jgi:hypothetical protein
MRALPYVDGSAARPQQAPRIGAAQQVLAQSAPPKKRAQKQARKQQAQNDQVKEFAEQAALKNCRTRKASSQDREDAHAGARGGEDGEAAFRPCFRGRERPVIRANGTVRITTPHGRFFIRSVVTRLQQICAERRESRAACLRRTALEGDAGAVLSKQPADLPAVVAHPLVETQPRRAARSCHLPTSRQCLASSPRRTMDSVRPSIRAWALRRQNA